MVAHKALNLGAVGQNHHCLPTLRMRLPASLMAVRRFIESQDVKGQPFRKLTDYAFNAGRSSRGAVLHRNLGSITTEASLTLWQEGQQAVVGPSVLFELRYL